MAIKFIKSSDIQVFPAVHRAPAYAISKRTTEDNLTKFGKLSSNKDNLSQMFEDPDDPLYVIFNIAGYWFRCLETKIPSGDNLYAYIKLMHDDTNTIGYMLIPTDSLTIGGALDAIVGSDDDESFKGLAFDDHIPSTSGALYYGLKIKNGSSLAFQNLKLDASEIRNTGGDDTKNIEEEFDTGILTATTINGVTIDQTTGELDITDDKTAAINVNLNVGSSEKTGDVTIQSNGTSPTTITGPDNGTTILLNGEMVEKDAAQTLKNKTFVAPELGAATAISINKVTITEPATNATLTIANDKTVAAFANLTVGDALSNTGGVTIKSSTINNSIITAPGNGSVTLFAGEMVEKDKTQTLTNKTLTSPILTTPKIKDSDASHYYNFAVSNLTADRTITLPLLTGNDEFVFKSFAQTLTNKTLTSPMIDEGDINGGTVDSLTSLSVRDTSAAFDVTIAGTSSSALTAGRKLTLDIVNADKTIKLTGSPSLSGITTTGTGTLALNKNLTANSSLTLAGTDSKTLTINDSVTIGTNEITLGSNKSLTMQYGGLTVGDSAGTGLITLKSNNSSARSLTLQGSPTLIGDNTLTLTNASLTVGDSNGKGNVTIKTSDSTARSLTLTGSPTLSAITTTGSGTLALGTKTLTVGATLTLNGTDGKTATISDTITINKPLTVGSSSTYTGEVIVQSAGSSPTIIRGPDNGTIILPSGTALVNSGSQTAGSFDTLSVNPTSDNRLNYDGYLYATRMYSNAFYAHSDERLKENIIDYKYHDSILDIAVKEFDYKETGNHAIGFIAQELQAKFPELVTSDDNGYLAISESKLVYLLLEEVKLLKEEIKKLKE